VGRERREREREYTGHSRPLHTMEELRREARRLEHALDSAMVQFGRLDLSEPGSSGAFEARAEEIEGMLQNLQDVNDQLSRQASSATGSAASTMHVLQRHREILHDFMQEFSKTKHNLKLADERQQLLSSVRCEPCTPSAQRKCRVRTLRIPL